MRIGDIVCLAAVVMAALVGATTVQAAAAPGNVAVTMETGGPLDPLELLPIKESQFAARPKACEVCLPFVRGFSTPMTHELTIVVRLQEHPYRVPASNPNPVPSKQWSFGRPMHAIRRDSWLNAFNSEQDAKAVLDTLRNKLLELNEKEWFEVEFSPRGPNRAEMRIRYTPVFPEDFDYEFGSDAWPSGYRGEGWRPGMVLTF